MSEVTEEELKTRATGKRVTLEGLEANIKKTDFYTHPDSQLTICILTLQNGYTITGQSACADPTNYKQDIGERLAKEDAKKKIWALMGYALKEEIHRAGLPQEGGFYSRLVQEKNDLADKWVKLNAFIEGNHTFKSLDPVDQSLLISQENHMRYYLQILQERVDRQTIVQS